MTNIKSYGAIQNLLISAKYNLIKGIKETLKAVYIYIHIYVVF